MQGNEQPPAQSDAVFSERQIRMLKIANIVMAVILVLGFAVVIGRIVQLSNRPAADPTSAKPGTGPLDVRLAIPAAATIRSTSLSGGRLAIHYDAPVGPGIAVLDLATGTVTHRIVVVPEPPRN